MSKDITIHSYPNNGNGKPRQPLVHLLGGDDYVVSIAFHPDDAPAIAKAILRAGHAAKAGRKLNAIKIDLKPHG